MEEGKRTRQIKPRSQGPRRPGWDDDRRRRRARLYIVVERAGREGDQQWYREETLAIANAMTWVQEERAHRPAELIRKLKELIHKHRSSGSCGARSACAEQIDDVLHMTLALLQPQPERDHACATSEPGECVPARELSSSSERFQPVQSILTVKPSQS